MEEVQSIPPAEGIWATINDWMGFQPPSIEQFDVLIMADPLLMKLGTQFGSGYIVESFC